MHESGMTVVEILIALIVVATVTLLGLASLSGLRERAALNGSADAVARGLTLARSLAVARRETVRVTRLDLGVAILDSGDSLLSALPVGRHEDLSVDSLSIRPPVIRFNARGHAGAGSVYLWRGDRGVRLVINFLGRVRREEAP